MSRIKAYFQPNFNAAYFPNWVAVIGVFLLTFTYTSAFAFEDDGSWDNGYFYISNGNEGPTHQSVCVPPRPYVYGSYCSGSPSQLYSGALISKYSCYSTTGDPKRTGQAWINTGCGTTPEPVPPENCTEYALQNPDGVSATISGYQAEFCVNGCNASFGGVAIKSADSDDWTGDAQLTGGSCNGGYQDGLGAQEIIDFYAHDAQLQNCYDSTGKLIGQISTALSCPTLDICYDVSTGNAVGTTSQSASCTTGVKYNDLDQAVKNENVAVSESETLNPDGSSEVVKDTVTTQTGLDGSTESTIETTTTNKDSSGTTTSEETKTRKELSSGSDYCDVKPNDPLCKLVKDNSAASLSGNCDTPPTCSGDPVGCASVRLQWEKFCADQSATESDFESWRTDSATVTKYGVDVDSNGVLTSLGKGEIDVQDTLGLSSLGDTGAAGSCPSPIDLGLLGAVIPFSFDTICDYATTARPLVIFASLYLCMVMVRRSLLGA